MFLIRCGSIRAVGFGSCQCLSPDTSRHYNRLLKWNIEDRRLDLLMKYLVLNYKIKFLNQYNEIINQEIMDIFFSTETNSTHFEPEKSGTIKRIKLIMTKKERAKESKKHKQKSNIKDSGMADRNLEDVEFDIESNLENSELNELETEYNQKFMNIDFKALVINVDDDLKDSNLEKQIAIPLVMDGNIIEEDGKSTRSRGKSKMSKSGVSRRTTKTNKTENKARINYEERGRVIRQRDLHGPGVYVLRGLPHLYQDEGRQTAQATAQFDCRDSQYVSIFS